eukprot:6426672-Amphidinium_carterae.2
MTELGEIKSLLQSMQLQLAHLPTITNQLREQQTKIDALEKRMTIMERQQHAPPGLAPTIVTELRSSAHTTDIPEPALWLASGFKEDEAKSAKEWLLSMAPGVLEQWDSKRDGKATVFMKFATDLQRWTLHTAILAELRTRYPNAIARLARDPKDEKALKKAYMLKDVVTQAIEKGCTDKDSSKLRVRHRDATLCYDTERLARFEDGVERYSPNLKDYGVTREEAGERLLQLDALP